MSNEIPEIEKKAAFLFGEAGDPVVEQFRGLVELARWALVFALAVYSFIVPLFGIIFGIILIKAAVIPKNKGLGKLCLILGIISVALWCIYLLVWALALGGIFAGLGSVS
ncbi:MAG: hypothetical protein GTN49_00200 [candidate division Zixibacteria bacterium]|nr:hypothetical protein [candidate division Zixibacteria bacterium]